MQVKARVVPAPVSDRRQVFLAELHNPAVDLHQVEVFHPWVAQAFAGGSAITAADHQHAFDGLGRAERRMY